MEGFLSEISDDSLSDEKYYLHLFPQSEVEEIEDENNGELFLDRHLSSSQRRLIDSFEFNGYKREKRSNKKLKARRQIKDKNGRSIRNNNSSKPLYINHRLWKIIDLETSHRNSFGKVETVPLYSVDELRSILRLKREFYRQATINFQDVFKPVVNQPPINNFALNPATLTNEPTFDDAMIAFLLDLQNRDLSPEDYENLLRLDERVQKKTVQSSVFDSLINIQVNETQLNEFCSICMENYLLGQNCKVLPCTHIFHSDCIQNYLLNFSNQCPLDNLPLT